ncbi:RNA-directed DNA polymerase, eukaryota [Tanacetum coccineum]
MVGRDLEKTRDATIGINADGNNDENFKEMNGDDDCEVKGVSDTIFGDQEINMDQNLDHKHDGDEQEVSSDLFGLNELINNYGKVDAAAEKDSSIPFPPGFTPDRDQSHCPVLDEHGKDISFSQCGSEGISSRVMEDAQHVNVPSPGVDNQSEKGGSVLGILDDIIKVGQAMGYNMEGCLGSKAKKDWIKGLNNFHKVTFLTIQETKMDCISEIEIKALWGNYSFEYIFSEAVGASGGILCVWDPCYFSKDHHILSDNFVALYGTWIPKREKVLLISIYAPQSVTSKRILWDYIASLVCRWNGLCMVMGDFNEVRCKEDRLGSVFNVQGANEFNGFVSNSELIEIQLEGFTFTWTHPSFKKMSKLDRFFVNDGMLSSFPHLSAVCLDRHLSDHRPILLREVFTDYGPTPFRFYHAWFRFEGFDQMVFTTWNNIALDDRNVMIRFKKKLQLLKKEIRIWIGNYKKNHAGHIDNLRANLKDIDKIVDSGDANDDILLSRVNLLKEINDFQASNTREGIQKAKIKWAVEGDENSKFFHGVINRRRANLAIKGVMVDGEWVDDPTRVKEEFKSHFASRFQTPTSNRCCLNFTFPKRLDTNQAEELEGPISIEEVRKAVWGCGDNKSPGPDGFTFEFFRKYWDLLGTDLYDAVVWFFDKGSFARGCNTSFITLIPKIQDPKFVSDYRPISLIGCLYKVITKILANRISLIIPDLISDVQSAFLPNRQILDGPFIINELLSWCKYKKQQAMVFKVDFAKAYDSVRWDFLQDILTAFGFGSKWCSWIRGCLQSATASVLLNGSPTSEFHFECGLKQGDPLAPFLFILVMETLHLSFVRATEAGIFTGLKIGTSFSISHLFYADDAVFIGEWSNANLSGITKILHCFSLLSGLNINLKKSHLLGVGIANEVILAAAENLGGEDIDLRLRLVYLRWKLKALSIGGSLAIGGGLRNCYSISASFRRSVRGGAEASQLDLLQEVIQNVILSNIDDRWTWDLNGDGVFRVRDVRVHLDDFFLPKADTPTRWVKFVPIKVNIFAWKLYLDRLPTRDNLLHRGVFVPNSVCPICTSAQEDCSHLFFKCCLVTNIVRRICRWWNIDWSPLGSYIEWLSWFKAIRLNSFLKSILEGVFYTACKYSKEQSCVELEMDAYAEIDKKANTARTEDG